MTIASADFALISCCLLWSLLQASAHETPRLPHHDGQDDDDDDDDDGQGAAALVRK